MLSLAVSAMPSSSSTSGSQALTVHHVQAFAEVTRARHIDVDLGDVDDEASMCATIRDSDDKPSIEPWFRFRLERY